MNLFKKFFRIFFVAAIFFNLPNVSFAETQEFSAEGEYRLGDDDSRSTAKIKAINDAKRKIIEQIGVYVQSYSEMNHFNLDKELVRTVSAAMIKIKSESVEFTENGTLCKVFLVADADTDNQNIQISLEKILNDNTKKPDKAVLKVAGIWEFNNHYYKVFNEGMNWYEANKRCKDLGGHLVTITSQEEQAAVQSIILYAGKKKKFYWTGGFSVVENQWEWITREAFTYENWAEGEPNRDFENEFILSIYNSGEWNDCPPEGISHLPGVDSFRIENSGFICEWDSFEDIKT